jgi:hypothetical protein
MSEFPEEEPPVFSSWNSWYWLVLGVMAVQVIVFALLTLSFS